MGKTQKPLSILVISGELAEHPELVALKDKGHTVSGVDLGEYDVIIGSKAWRIIPEMGDVGGQLAMMLAGVRAGKYPKGGK